MSIFAMVCAERLPAQTAASVPQPASSQPSSDSHSIALTIPDGTPLQIALDKEVCVQKVGQPIHGHVMQPVYVFDHLVIPVGTAATGRISAIDPVPGRTRVLDALNADFTPARKLAVVFDELILPDGRHISLHATVVPGSGQVIRLVSAGEHKKNVVKDAAAQKMDQARAQWNNAMKQVESPGKMHRFVRYAVAQLPAHPQYIDAGTLYSAELPPHSSPKHPSRWRFWLCRTSQRTVQSVLEGTDSLPKLSQPLDCESRRRSASTSGH